MLELKSKHLFPFVDCKFNCHRKGCAEKAPKNCQGEVAMLDTGELKIYTFKCLQGYS